MEIRENRLILGLTRIRPLSCGFDSSVGRALHWHRRGRGFESRSEPEFFSGLCSSSVTAALALMTVRLILDNYFQWFKRSCVPPPPSSEMRKHLDTFFFTSYLANIQCCASRGELPTTHSDVCTNLKNKVNKK